MVNGENISIVAYNTFYHSWHEAMGELPDEEYGKLCRALNEYCFYGIVPELSGVSKMLFVAFKANIDASTRNKLSGREGGKRAKGNSGAPRGNQNARKNNSTLLNNQYPPIEQNNSKVKVDVEVKEDEDININRSSSEVVSSKQPTTTTTVDFFINSCKEAGYSLDRKTAGEILDAGLDPAWLEGPHSFPEYIAEVMREKYRDKTQEENRRLFRTILAAEDRKADFPVWREKKIADATAQAERCRKEAVAGEQRRQIEEARENPPKICSHCGKPIAIQGRRGDCPSCKYDYFFNDETGVWECSEPIDFESVLAGLAKPAEAQKPPPLREREPVNDFEKVEKVYLLNWDSLLSQGKVKTPNPIADWNQTRALLKNHFKTIMPEQIIKAVNNGMSDDFVLQGGYSLATMLSSSVLNRLINADPKTGTKHRIENDNVSEEDISKYFRRI